MKFILGQKIINVLTLKKLRGRFKAYKLFKRLHINDEIRIKQLRQKIARREKIKVAFLHMYATSIQNECIFERMLASDIFDPYYIVNPDVYRSKENFDYNYKRTKSELIEKYGKERVLDGYDYEKDEYFDYSEDFDMATTSNPYDAMVHEFFSIKYWAKKCLMFYIPYFYMGRCYVTKSNLEMYELSLFWKVFVENKYVMEMAKEFELIRGRNVIIAGYPKMDKIQKLSPVKKDKKLIIIAPHHSIDMDLAGSFLEWADYLPTLVEKYNDIDFVFRPHPMLVPNLYKDEFWGKEKTDKWLNDFVAHKNVTYSTEGDYLQVFVDSDALMHDCGSFSAEYLYFNKPCAFFMKKDLQLKKIMTPFGIEGINHHYALKNYDDCCKFIEKVVKEGNDIKKSEREIFAQNEVMINYPNAADFIYNNICSVLR